MNTPKKHTFDEVLDKANTSPEFKEEYDTELARLRTPDWEKEFRETDFYRIMNDNAPITDMIEYIRQSRLQDRQELVKEVNRLKMGSGFYRNAYDAFEDVLQILKD